LSCQETHAIFIQWRNPIREPWSYAIVHPKMLAEISGPPRGVHRPTCAGIEQR